MNATMLSESLVEKACLDWFQKLGYQTFAGAAISERSERDHEAAVLLGPRTVEAVQRLNPQLTEWACLQVVRVLPRPASDSGPEQPLVPRLLTDGVEVEYRDAKSGETRGGRARLIDFDNPADNDLLVVRQLTSPGRRAR